MAEEPAPDTVRGLAKPCARDERAGGSTGSEDERAEADEPATSLRNEVDHQSAASFPASDPPGWWAGA